MYWANFLHLYQPYDQKPEILKSIVESSYFPLIKNIRKNDKVRLTDAAGIQTIEDPAGMITLGTKIYRLLRGVPVAGQIELQEVRTDSQAGPASAAVLVDGMLYPLSSFNITHNTQSLTLSGNEYRIHTQILQRLPTNNDTLHKI